LVDAFGARNVALAPRLIHSPNAAANATATPTRSLLRMSDHLLSGLRLGIQW
jgi:hypothetical protein